MRAICTIAGLVLGIVGAWGLAYEILWGFPRRNKKETHESRLNSLRESASYLENSIRNYPRPPYDDEEIERILKELHDHYDPMIRKEEDKIAEYSIGHRERSFNRALLGIALLTLGFILQIIGAIH
ncbi:hypothetical protein KAX17_03395 [Candidatus Bipolaricaulota bacterium]|nr:hypothetical protein [Candidatus Bipolaricaulota bacterium]